VAQLVRQAMNDADLKLATEHHRAGRLADAEPIYRQMLLRFPNHGEGRSQLAYLLYQQGKFDLALGEVQKAIGQGASMAPSHNTLGLTLVALGRVEEGIAAYQKAIAQRPDIAELHNNLGNAYESVERLEEAAESLRRAVELRPGSCEAHDNLGRVLKKQGKFGEAIDEHLKSISLNPGGPGAHLDLGLLYLLMGDLRRGWIESEWRWKIVQSSVPQPAFDEKMWAGEELNGQRIFLHHDGGFGDTIQFLRYVPLVVARGGKVLLGVPRELVTLLQNYPGVTELIPSQEEIPEFDVHRPLASLPRIFDTTVETVPAQVPYLYPARELVEFWKNRLAGNRNLKVGLVWAGRPDYANDHNRSMALAQLAPLGDVPGVTFYSLQKGAAAEQKALGPPEGMNLVNLSPQLTDFLQTAAVLANLDLVITVDTSVAHVAGALGRPVWVFLPWVCDWRWMLDREDSPWYPTMRLFRQPAWRDWETPIRRVADELRRVATDVEGRWRK
jgi:Flp pilus assembly protein TadD